MDPVVFATCDPGLNSLGLAGFRVAKNGNLKFRGSLGYKPFRINDSRGYKLYQIRSTISGFFHKGYDEWCNNWFIDAFVCEQYMVSKGKIHSAIPMLEVTGVIEEVVHTYGIPCFILITAKEWKLILTGSGNAKGDLIKEKVLEELKKIGTGKKKLKYIEKEATEHEIDAIGIGIAYWLKELKDGRA